MALLLAALPLAGCGEREADHEQAGDTTSSCEDPIGCSDEFALIEDDRAAHEAGYEGHGHGEEGSDLDRPVAELFAARCEHDMAAHECEDCRYEVGVACVSSNLIKSGLVQLEPVLRRDLDAMLRLTGEIQFDERSIAHLGPRVSGVVDEVQVELGDRVEAGRLLAILTSHELAEAQSEYLLAMEDRRVARLSLDRQTSLRKDGISSERDYLESQQNSRAAEIRADLAKQRLLRFGLVDSEIIELRDGIGSADGHLKVRAPFSGEVLSLHAVLGEQIEAGEEVILLGDTSSLWAWVDIYESQLARLRKALDSGPVPVKISVQSELGRSFDGEIDHLNRWMDEHTRTVRARIILDNRKGDLHPGMFAEARVSLGVGRGPATIPATALLEDEGRSFVFMRHEGDYFVRRPVVTGKTQGGWVELLDGPAPGEEVVTAGAFLLKSDVLRSKMGEGCAH